MYKRVLDEFYRLPVEKVMKKTGYAVLPKDVTVLEVLETLIDFGHIWITEYPGSNRVVGVIARKDFVEMVLPPQFNRMGTPGRAESKTLYYDGAVITAEDMMTRNVVKVEVGTEMKEVLKQMSVNFVRQVPVVRRDELVGEVSMHDLIRNFVELYKFQGRKEGTGGEPCPEEA